MTGPQAKALPARVQTVLVVDDHEGFRLRTRRLLERHQYRVIDARDGATAISRARRHQPDIILLDIHLPDMDGFQVAAELREAGATGAILLISTHPATDVAGRLTGSAADAFIDKADLSAKTIATTLAQIG